MERRRRNATYCLLTPFSAAVHPTAPSRTVTIRDERKRFLQLSQKLEEVAAADQLELQRVQPFVALQIEQWF